MAENKTQPTAVDAYAFVQGNPDPVRRQDGLKLIELMKEITGEEPVMWGPTIVGFGKYHYQYDSGHQGDAPVAGFSPRKAELVLYIVPGFQSYHELLARLGKHKTGKSCLYIKKLADVDMAALRELVQISVKEMEPKRVYPH